MAPIPTTTLSYYLFIIIISFCFLYLLFDIYIMWFLRSNKRWLSERFSLLSRYELLLLEHFLFCFNIFIFLYDYQFLFSFSSFSHHISSFWMLLTLIFLFCTILFYLCIYPMFFTFKQMTWSNFVQSWQ